MESSDLSLLHCNFKYITTARPCQWPGGRTRRQKVESSDFSLPHCYFKYITMAFSCQWPGGMTHHWKVEISDLSLPHCNFKYITLAHPCQWPGGKTWIKKWNVQTHHCLTVTLNASQQPALASSQAAGLTVKKLKVSVPVQYKCDLKFQTPPTLMITLVNDTSILLYEIVALFILKINVLFK